MSGRDANENGYILTDSASLPYGKFTDLAIQSVLQASSNKNEASHANLIYFLALCQKLEVDFLPITWQPAQVKLGDGGQATIRQSHLSSNTSFAFRQFRSSTTEISGQSRNDAYKALIREVNILKYSETLRCPYIVDLLGVCWDVSTPEVWPVLVFEKAKYGDLNAFMASEEGKKLGLAENLGLWLHVAAAVLNLHSANIVHADIKPQNILIVNAEPSGFCAILSDLGYAHEFTSSEELTRMPKSVPWTAPEHHHRGFSFNDAVRMDLYSLGMLLLWLLARDSWSSVCEKVESSRFMLSRACDFVMENATFTEEFRSILIQFLKATLAARPADRNPEILQLIRGLPSLYVVTKLSHDPNLMASSPAPPKPSTGFFSQKAQRPHMDFQLAMSFDLIKAYHRVQTHICASLQSLAESSTCSQCKMNASYQLALCARIGFGMQRSQARSKIWLERSGMSDLDEQLEITKYRGREYHNSFVSDLAGRGLLNPVDFAHQDSHEDTKQIITQYEIQLENLSASLGQHWAVSWVRNVLASLLSSDGQWRKAEHLYSERVQELEQDQNSTTISKLHALSNLATVLSKQNKLKEAEEILRQVVGGYKELGDLEREDSELEDLDNLTAQENLASVLHRQGNYKEEEVILRRTLAYRKVSQGEEHENTLMVESNLAQNLLSQGNYKLAESMSTDVLDRMSRAIESHHETNIGCVTTAIRVLRLQGKASVAEEKCLKFISQCEKIFGSEHVITLAAHSELALTLQDLGKYDAAEKLNRILLESYLRLWPHHSSTLTCMNNLANTLQWLGRYEEAEEINRRALRGFITLYGTDHPSTLACMGNLAGVLNHQAKYGDAEKMHHEVLEAKKRSLGDEHPNTLRSAISLAVTYRDRNKHNMARALLQETIQSLQNTLGDSHPLTLQAQHEQVCLLLEKAEYGSAEHMCRKVVTSRTSTLGSKHPDTLKSKETWAQVLEVAGNAQEAETVLEQVFEDMAETIGYLHPRTLQTRARLASMQYALRKFNAAEQSYQQAIDGLHKIYRSEHPLVLSCTLNLTTVLRMQGKLEQAEDKIRRVLNAYEGTLGPNHVDTASSRWHLTTLLMDTNRLIEAHRECQCAYDGFDKAYGNIHPKTEECRVLFSTISERMLAENSPSSNL